MLLGVWPKLVGSLFWANNCSGRCFGPKPTLSPKPFFRQKIPTEPGSAGKRGNRHSAGKALRVQIDPVTRITTVAIGPCGYFNLKTYRRFRHWFRARGCVSGEDRKSHRLRCPKRINYPRDTERGHRYSSRF